MTLSHESLIFLAWTLGPAALLAVSNILQKVGLDRVAHRVHTHRPGEWVRTVAQNLLWWCGIAIAAVATVGYYGALGRYNISLVQPLMALNPVLTALVGWWILKEHMDRRTGWAIVLVVVGLGCAGLLHGEARGQEHQMRMLVFVAVSVGLALSVRFVVFNVEARKSLIAGVGFGLSAVLMKSLEEHFHFHGGGNLQGSDWLGAPLWQVIGHVDIFLRAAGYVASYIIGFIYMQVALTHGRALLVIPLTSAIGMLVPTLAGILVFQEPCGFAKLGAVGLVMLGSALFVRLK